MAAKLPYFAPLSFPVLRIPVADPVTIPAEFSRYSDFKHRLWYLWYIFSTLPECDYAACWAIVRGSDSNQDLWLWEDEDEECIKSFVEADGFFKYPQMPVMAWNDASRALERRLSRTTIPTSPLAHLPPRTRLRLIAWLLVARPLRKQIILQEEGTPTITKLIRHWARVVGLPWTGVICQACRVSDVLSVWIETMLEVYSREDVGSLQLEWSDHECSCFRSQLTATASTNLGQRRVLEAPLGRNSPVLRVLYELVVPAWPLLLWVAYRTAANDQAESLTTFMDMIRCPGLDEDLIIWTKEDDFHLYRILSRAEYRSGLYPCDWSEYMLEIPLETWLQISSLTRRENRQYIGSYYDLKNRVAPMLLKYSSTLIARENILATVGITLDGFDGLAFDTMANAVDGDYQEQSVLANFDSEEFWASASLKNWLSACDETLCHGVWHTAHRMSSSERVQVMDLALSILPCNLATYVYSLMRRRRPHGHEFRGLEDLGRLTPFVPDYLGALRRYCQDVRILVGAVRNSVEKNSSTNHTISKYVHEQMKRDLSVVVARLVLFLRESYKEFLSSCGKDAQQLLDLLQDLLDLDSFSVVKPVFLTALSRLSRSSGLHPRCLALSGLQKVGQQVTGGGFGDIWKGLVRGQGVCVKIMRVFEDSNVEAVLKEFAREAVIWRQLCHPNVLPFFGIYYLDNRLCLVSPWMEYGNVLKFLAAKKPANPERLSLILDVALGLQYLHKRKIIHGDLKGLNILVTPSRRACIADFGVCSIANAMTVRFTHTTVTARASTARYQAPELFRGESENHLGSDVYAFACVCHEIMTEKVPFHELPNDMTVMFKVLEGHRPSRPLSCSATALDGLWELMQKCWEEHAQMRPTAAEIVERLLAPSIAAQPTPFNTDWSDEFTSKFRRSQQAEPLLPSVSQLENMLFGKETAEACPECFPPPEPSDRQDEQVLSSVAQQPKRRYEDSNPDSEGVTSEQPAAKKSKGGST